jgi:hypothetical protein
VRVASGVIVWIFDRRVRLEFRGTQFGPARRKTCPTGRNRALWPPDPRANGVQTKAARPQRTKTLVSADEPSKHPLERQATWGMSA